MRIRHIFTILGLGLSLAACGSMHPVKENMELLAGPAPQEYTSPYKAACDCLRRNMTPEQQQTIFAVGHIPDRTGRMTYSSNSAAGTMMTQGAEDMLATSLAMIGVNIADYSPAYRNQFDWTVGRIGSRNITMDLPDVIINGSINSLDFIPGGGFQINGTLQAGRLQHRILLGFDARATTMPTNPTMPVGKVVTSFGYTKQVVAVENNLGGSALYSLGAVSAFTQIEFGKNEREPLQYMARMAMDIVAWKVVRDYTGITACDEIFEKSGLGIAISK